MRKRWTLLLLTCLITLTGNAAQAQQPQAINLERAFAVQHQAILEDLRGDKYVEISPQDRQTVLEALERIAARLGDQADDVLGLSEADRVALFNDQSLVNSLLTQAGEDSRVVCRREKTIGSQRVQNQCMTVAERRRAREAAQHNIVQARRTGKTTN